MSVEMLTFTSGVVFWERYSSTCFCFKCFYQKFYHEFPLKEKCAS